MRHHPYQKIPVPVLPANLQTDAAIQSPAEIVIVLLLETVDCSSIAVLPVLVVGLLRTLKPVERFEKLVPQGVPSMSVSWGRQVELENRQKGLVD